MGLPIILSPGIWTHSDPQKIFLSVCHWLEPLLRGDPLLETTHLVRSRPQLPAQDVPAPRRTTGARGVRSKAVTRSAPPGHSLLTPGLCGFQPRPTAVGEVTVHFLDPYFSLTCSFFKIVIKFTILNVSNCDTTHIKSTILTIFKCTIQWH